MATAIKKTSVKKTDTIKNVSIRRKAPTKASSATTSRLNLVRLTRNELYLPEDYKIVLDYVRRGVETTTEMLKTNPMKRKSTIRGNRDYYYNRLKKMAELGLLQKERYSYHNGVSCVNEFRYTAVELTPVKLGQGEFLDVTIRL